MKKLLTLFLLFTITLFYSIPSEAYTLNGNDIPIAALNGLTLNQVFDNGNLIVNHDFNNGTTGFNTLAAYSISASNNILTLSNISGAGPTFWDGFILIGGNQYYYRAKIRTTLTSISALNFRLLRNDLGVAVGSVSASNPKQNQWYELSNIFTPTIGNTWSVQIALLTSTTGTVAQVDGLHGVYAIDLTALGINLNKDEMDYYFNEFRLNNTYIEGYNEGFDVGFDDSIASDTAYSLGYALGLSEGQDMETGSSLLILIVAVIGFVMMIFGFATKRGIFNLLSVAAFVVLGTLLVEFVGFIIIAVGLVFINVYYAFFGDL